MMDKVTIINSTLGKALGGAAGEGIFLSRVLHALKSSTASVLCFLPLPNDRVTNACYLFPLVA